MWDRGAVQQKAISLHFTLFVCVLVMLNAKSLVVIFSRRCDNPHSESDKLRAVGDPDSKSVH